MKFIVLAFFVTLQVITASAVLAWSPLDSFEPTIESMQQCYAVVAGSEDDKDSNKNEEEEEEEEPDCD